MLVRAGVAMMKLRPPAASPHTFSSFSPKMSSIFVIAPKPAKCVVESDHKASGQVRALLA